MKKTINDQPELAIIIAVDDEYGIGRDGAIPWHYAEDMKFFRSTTSGAGCIMGRNTYVDLLEIMGERVNILPKRKCVVITSHGMTTPGAIKASSLTSAIELCDGEPTFFIGGKSIYEAALEYVNTVYITHIPGKHNCDVIVDAIKHAVVESPEFLKVSEEYTDSGLIFSKYTKR